MEVSLTETDLLNEIENLKMALREANSRNRYVPVIQNYKSYKETFNRLLQIDEAIKMVEIQQDAIKDAMGTIKIKLEEIIQEI